MEWLIFARQILLSDAAIGSLVLLIAANVFFAVLVAARTGTFDLRQFANVFGRDLLPKVGGYAVLRWLLSGIPEGDLVGGSLFGLAATVAYGIIVSELLARIVAHIQALGLSREPAAHV